VSALRDMAAKITARQTALFHNETRNETRLKQGNSKPNSLAQSCFSVSPLRNETLKHAVDGTVWLSEHLRDAYDERAAIFEYDAGMSREQASHAAWKDIMTSEGIIVHD
jgi:hypothetical protein